MKKICISVAALLAVFMTGCETYEDTLKTALTETEAVSETPMPLEPSSEVVVDSEPSVTETPADVSTDLSDAMESINLNYDAISSMTASTEVPSTDVSGDATGVSDATGTAAVSGLVGSYTSEDGRPPLPDDLKDFYTSALEVYSKIYYCSFTADASTPVWVNGKNGYIRVTDARFPDYQSLYTFASYYFTDELMQTKILPYGQTSFVDKYGAFYMGPATNVKNPAYAGHVFKNVTQSTTEIVCTADVYYLLGTDAVNTAPIFYTEPANKSLYAVTQVTFKLVPFENRWKFSEFTVIG
ncbi:MAG: hypothetical protein ACI4JM_08670 [Oscillospiraceae bacterium]